MPPEISAIPQDPLLGAGAGILAKIKQVAEAMAGSSMPNAAPVGKLIEMLMGNKAKAVEDMSYGFPPTQGTGMTLGPKSEYAGDVADVIPWGKAATAAKMMAGKILAPEAAAGVSALAGVLRPGGRKDLMLSHGISGGLEGYGGKELINELMHPSLAITGGGQLKNEFAGGGLLIPKPGAFDPAYSPSQLFNRDAYLARTHEFPGGRGPSAEQRVANYGLLPPPQSEGGTAWRFPGYEPPPATTPHMAAIEASPYFRSFAEYEKSPKGAGVLGAEYADIAEWNDKFSRGFSNWWNDKFGSVSNVGLDKLKMLQEYAGKGDRQAQDLLTSAQRAPSEYGELKVSGAVPLTSERWAGAILKPHMAQQFEELLAGRGIPTARTSGIETPYMLHKIADAMQELAGPVKERSLRTRAGWAPGQQVEPRPAVIEAATKPEPFVPGQPTQGVGGAENVSGKLHHDPEFEAWLGEQPAPLGTGAKPGVEWMHSPGVIKKDQFSELAAANFNPDVSAVFTHAGSEYRIHPSGTIYMKGIKEPVAHLDIPFLAVREKGCRRRQSLCGCAPMISGRPQQIIWQPQPGPQTHLIACPVFEVFYGGARGGGKTEGSIGDWLDHSGRFGSAANGVFFRRTLKQLEEVVARTQELFPRLGAKFNEQKATWAMPGGARLKFRYLEKDKDAQEYQGHSYTRVYVEEVTNFPSPAPINLLRGTLRSATGVPVGMRLTGNPGGPGHHWVKARYITPDPRGYRVLEDHLKGLNGEDLVLERVFIPSKLNDNILLQKNDPFYVARLRQAGSEALVKAWLEGNWDLVDGAFFDCWDPKLHVLPNHWLHRIPEYALRFRAFDWGYGRPFSCGWYAVSDGTWGLPEEALVKYREWYGSTGKPNEGCKLNPDVIAAGILTRELVPNSDKLDKDHPLIRESIAYGVADPSIYVRDGGPSIMETFAANGVFWRRADNKRIPGWSEMRRRLVGIGGKPLLYFLECCDDSIRTIPTLQVDETDPEDLDTEAEDHAADETRYSCMSRPWTEFAPETEDALVYPKRPDEMTINELIARRTEARMLQRQDAA